MLRRTMERRWLDATERAAPWLAGLVLAAPIVAVRYPPMGDLAMHEALVAILRHRGEPGWAPPGLYGVVAPQANQLFAWLATLLSFVMPTDAACKVVVAASVFAAPPAAARLLGRLGQRRWLALLLGPVACGWMFRWGLVANLTGLAALLVALPSVERLARRPTGGAAAACALSVAVVFFAHESSAVALAVVAGVFALVRGRTAGGVALRMAPALLVLALVLVQWKVSDALVSPGMRIVGTYFGAGVGERLLGLPGAVFGGLGAARLVVVGGVWCAALFASALGRRPAPAAPLRVACWRHRYALLAATFVLLFLVFPMGVGGTTLVAYRFLPAACIGLVAACAARARSWPVVALSVAAPLAILGAEARDFVRADGSYRALDRIIALVPRDVAVAQLDLTPRGPGHVAPVPGAASRVLAERGGRMLFAMTDMPPNPVVVPEALRWNEPVRRLVATPYAFAPAHDLTRFGYLLVRDESPAMRPLVARALAPEAELVASEREWALFRSRLPTVPLTAPDGPLPEPPPETLAARVQRLLPAAPR